MINKYHIQARFAMRLAGIPTGLSVPDHVRHVSNALADVTSEVLEEIQKEQKVVEEREETREIIEAAVYILTAIVAFILLLADQVYYALTFSVLAVIFLLIYKIAMAFYFKRPSQ